MMQPRNNTRVILLVLGLLVGILLAMSITRFSIKQSKNQAYNKSAIRRTSNIESISRIANFQKSASNIVIVIARQGNNNSGQLTGCGVIYDNSGHIITNRHIVENLESAFISVKGKEFKARVLGSDKELDIAVLRVEEDIDLSPISFADSSKVKIGQPIVVMGKPFIKKDSYTLTSGIISSLPIDLPKGWPTLLTVDAIVNPGNSGGPVVDENGEVIAITTAYQSTGQQTQGLGFAIPINEVLKAVEEILENE